MFYIKHNLPDGSAHCVDIESDNVFSRCIDCGAELQVDLMEMVDASGDLDLYGTHVRCAECTAKQTL